MALKKGEKWGWFYEKWYLAVDNFLCWYKNSYSVLCLGDDYASFFTDVRYFFLVIPYSIFKFHAKIFFCSLGKHSHMTKNLCMFFTQFWNWAENCLLFSFHEIKKRKRKHFSFSKLKWLPLHMFYNALITRSTVLLYFCTSQGSYGVWKSLKVIKCFESYDP